jgi:two-component system, chemotaxis family, chemotaxis protein CheY
MLENSGLLEELLHQSASDDAIKELFELAIIGSLTRKVLHESNNQLTGILGYLILARKTPSLSEDVISFLERSIQCCEKNKTISNSFLDLFRTGGDSSSCINERFLKVIDFCDKTFGSNCSIVYKQDGSLSEHPIAVNQLPLLLLYVLLAAKADLSAQGDIRVEASIDLNCGNENDANLFIDVYPQRMVSTASILYEHNESAASSRIMKQVSLELANEIAGKCKGEIVYDKNNIAPAKYTISVPFQISAPVSKGSDLPTKQELLPSDKKKKLLILEDQKMVSEFIQNLLVQHGFDVSIYDNGQTLANILSTIQLSEIDIFLLDIFVPGLDGIEVAKMIRGIHPDARIVFYSALQNEKNILNHFPLGGKTRFLQKPFQKEELFDVIQSILVEQE